MKKYIPILVIAIACNSEKKPEVHASNESIDSSTVKAHSIEDSQFVDLPNSQYAHYVYDSTLAVDLLHYEYTDLWDLDEDGIKDTICFISNGGAHAYYHLEVGLSTVAQRIEFPIIYTDFPYPEEIQHSNEIGEYLPAFVVHDFDADGLNEIYLNINHHFAPEDEELERMGLKGKQLLVDYTGKGLVLKDF